MPTQPLADKLRPQNFDEIAGQAHLCGENGTLCREVEQRGIGCEDTGNLAREEH